MNALTLNETPKNAKPDCADIMTMAERELAAFFNAVTELFGSEEAAHAVEDWQHELEGINDLPGSTREWRLITAKVATRLARRVHAPSQSSQWQVLKRKRRCLSSSQVPQAS